MVASAGMQADTKALHKVLQMRNVMYQHNHARPMSVSAVAQNLSNTLYNKRFFPYYTFNLVAGLDTEGAHPVGEGPMRQRRSLLAEEQGRDWEVRGAWPDHSSHAHARACRPRGRVQLRCDRLVRAQRLLLPGLGQGAHPASAGQSAQGGEPPGAAKAGEESKLGRRGEVSVRGGEKEREERGGSGCRLQDQSTWEERLGAAGGGGGAGCVCVEEDWLSC